MNIKSSVQLQHNSLWSASELVLNVYLVVYAKCKSLHFTLYLSSSTHVRAVSIHIDLYTYNLRTFYPSYAIFVEVCTQSAITQMCFYCNVLTNQSLTNRRWSHLILFCISRVIKIRNKIGRAMEIEFHFTAFRTSASLTPTITPCSQGSELTQSGVLRGPGPHILVNKTISCFKSESLCIFIFNADSELTFVRFTD